MQNQASHVSYPGPCQEAHTTILTRVIDGQVVLKNNCRTTVRISRLFYGLMISCCSYRFHLSGDDSPYSQCIARACGTTLLPPNPQAFGRQKCSSLSVLAEPRVNVSNITQEG